MKLNEFLEMKYTKSIIIPTLKDVYGIIYRIYCIPENKSYIGQTYSHKFIGKYLRKHGLIKRIQKHYETRADELVKDRPLYKALVKYETNQFEVFEERCVYEKELANINQIEGEYIKKYSSIYPTGYNIEEIGKTNSKFLKELSVFYEFDIKKTEYIDTTRPKRCKDVCIGTYFKLKRGEVNLERSFELLKTIEIDYIRLINSKGLRILVKLKNENINIRVYFNKSKEECLEYVYKLIDNVKISESFQGITCYKYQSKVDKIYEICKDVKSVTGTITNNKDEFQTYLIIFYGIKNNKNQSLKRVSFGGRSNKIEDSYNNAMEFIDYVKKNIETSHFIYKLKSL